MKWEWVAPELAVRDTSRLTARIAARQRVILRWSEDEKRAREARRRLREEEQFDCPLEWTVRHTSEEVGDAGGDEDEWEDDSDG